MRLAARLGRILRAQFSTHPPREVPRPPVAPPVRDPTISSYYANLELPYGADAMAVRAARKRLLARYHPDRYALEPERAHLANELVKRINQAHDALLNHLEES